MEQINSHNLKNGWNRYHVWKISSGDGNDFSTISLIKLNLNSTVILRATVMKVIDI